MLIPAFALTLISYFKLNKRYRFTRNRIVSIVMHLVIMVLAITLLAGMTIEYFKPNEETEVILLVDYSYTLDDSEEEVDDFIRDVVAGCNSMYKLGIVKFGYDQVYAVELTNDMEKVYSGYLSSANPDITATDLHSALTYAASLFTAPETARIVLLSDALETDSEAKTVIKSLAAKGISVDTVYFPGEAVGAEVQILDATQSIPKVEVNLPFEMILTVQSSITGTATITPYDNNEAGLPVEIELVEGLQTVNIPYTFAWGGMHVMSFDISCNGDTIDQNNTYVSYIYIETFSEVLIIESINAESTSLLSVLKEELNATVVNVADLANMPDTLDELRDFDEVVLLNVSNAQLPEGFDALLLEYVETVGGGLFTICGNTADSTQDNWTANAYTREDMYNKIYQKLLPVEIVEYTAPVGVIVIVDASGSMMQGGGAGGNDRYTGSKLNYAMDGARACLDALTERDYVGVMTLSDSYTEALTLTPRTQRDKILASIAKIEHSIIDGSLKTGGTIFSAAMERAGKALGARSDLEKKHIIIVTDGEPSSNDTALYEYWAKQNAALGITLTVIGVDSSSSAQSTMKNLVTLAGGDPSKNFINVAPSEVENLPTLMREQLEGPEIKSVNYETFAPTIEVQNSVTNGINQADMPTLDGYYGVKVKPEATVVLMGKYTPIYTQWEYGKGRVGTFACDLNGTWSADFLSSDVGATLLNNIIYALFPTENVRASDVEATISGDNYTTNLSIFADLGEGESIKVTVTSPNGTEQILVGDATTGFSRMTFAVKDVGLHTILVQKLNAAGEEISSKTLYKTLSYSKEYNGFPDTDTAKSLMDSLASSTEGFVITDPFEVFDHAVEYLHIVLDPRVLFSILIIVCFLIDIAVRKFKWKWPHEIIRDRKRKKTMVSK